MRTHPSSMDSFLESSSLLTDNFVIEKMKEVSNVVDVLGEDSSESLVMIDAMKRLGVDFYFQEMIDETLRRQSERMMSFPDHNSLKCLRDVALCFRLLRQERFHVTADIYINFKDKEGKFKLELCEDIEGLMELYEASLTKFEGECILDEAGIFSHEMLTKWIQKVDNKYSNVVNTTMLNPYHWSLPWFHSRESHFQNENKWVPSVMELAESQSGLLQSIHQKEIIQISRWWKNKGLASELSFVRDQPVKWHVWSMGILVEPNLSKERVEVTKSISLVYILDDMFDVQASNLDELALFTEAVGRWKLATVDHLPNYMKICFKALYDISNEICLELSNRLGWNPIEYFHKMWEKLCKAFLQEARWLSTGELPDADVYLKNGIVSSGVHVVLVHIFLLLGQGVTKESVHFLSEIPVIISSVAALLRLWDDLGSAQEENQTGLDGSYIECYMKEHRVSEECATQHASRLISNAWINLNKECFSQNSYPSAFTKSCLNAARMIPVIYGFDDNHNRTKLRGYVNHLLCGCRSI